jgi:hypothetical protein
MSSKQRWSRVLVSSPGESVFSIDLASGRAAAMPEVTLQSVGLRERDDLQRWITEYPEIVGPELLLISSEFDQWEIRDQRVLDRLDVLFLDASGSLVVAELKRDRASDTTDLQALKYAAYCDQLTLADVTAAYVREHHVEESEAEAALLEHAPSLVDGEFAPIKIRLVAGSFGPAVTTMVLWLRERDIDIGCVEVIARQQSEATAVLVARQILPLPEAEDYLVRRRRKEQVEESRRTSRRRLSSVAILSRAGVVDEGDVLTLKLEAFSAGDRPVIDALVAEHPAMMRASWLGRSMQQALRWEHDDEIHSATSIIRKMREMAGLPEQSIPGPDYWLLPSTGRAMYEESKLHEDAVADGLSD